MFASVPVSRLISVTKGELCGRFFVRAGEIEDVAGMQRPALPMAMLLACWRWTRPKDGGLLAAVSALGL
jgi:hypothetical protein